MESVLYFGPSVYWEHAPESHECEYCKTVTAGERCASCGAPRRTPIDESTVLRDKTGRVRCTVKVSTNNQGTK